MAEHAFADAICAGIRERRAKPVALPQLSAPVIAEQYLQLYRSLLYPASAFDTSPTPRRRCGPSEGDHHMNRHKQRPAAKLLGISVEALDMELALSELPASWKPAAKDTSVWQACTASWRLTAIRS